jgi:hypothetical protein
VFVLSIEQKEPLTDSKAVKLALLASDLSIKKAGDLIGISYTVLNDKILNRRNFKAVEIYKLSKLLRLSGKEVIQIFLRGYLDEEN